MCYSAQVWEDYRSYMRRFGADIDIKQFVALYVKRGVDPAIRIPRGMDAAFADPRTPGEREVRALIERFTADAVTRTQTELFAQTKRLADAERTLLARTTKAATQSQRIATDKIARARAKLADLRRTDARPQDARIFPGQYAPVLVMEHGQRRVLPMRYQCRPHGKPASYDTRYPGTYNARRDNLDRFWSGEFGTSHGILVVERFYENVERIDADGKPCNVVLEFVPADGQEMLVACLWSRWSAPGAPELLSFAAITDAPPPDVAAAGHDRCIVPIKPGNVDAWLAGGPSDAMHALLEDRDRPHYAFRLAA